MRIPKRYGESKLDKCPFCDKQSIAENEQGVPVCVSHKNKLFPEFKCMCGEYLLMQRGKFGAYFNCLSCGNVSMKKALEVNDLSDMDDIKSEKNTPERIVNNSPKNIIIRSDDPDYFD